LAILFEAVEQFRGEMLRIGGRSAVAAGHDLAARLQAGHHAARGGFYGCGHGSQRVELGLRAVLELLLNAFGK
jgi:hypothetical protein